MSADGSQADAAAAFTKLVEEDRKKLKAQKTADQIFGKRPSLKDTKRHSSTGPASLADRIGNNRVAKRPATVVTKGNIDGRWGHDLHHINNPRSTRGANLDRPASTSVLDRKNRLYDALKQHPDTLNSQFNVQSGVPLSIKGAAAAKPSVVIMSNLAPGTSPADIEAAVKDVTGKLIDCYLIAEAPTIIAELLCEDRRGAEKLVTNYNNSTTDGRLLHVYIKPGGPSPRVVKEPTPPPAPRALSPPLSAPTQPAADAMEIDADRNRAPDERDGRSRSGYANQDRRHGNYSYERYDRPRYWNDTRGSRGYYEGRSFNRGRGYR